MRERVTIRIDRAAPSAADLKGYFAQLLTELDARPRPLLVTVDARNDSGTAVVIDFKDGEPVFQIDGAPSVRAAFRGRWLPEHPVPLRLPARGCCRLVFTPTDGNRVKVRRATFWERIFA